MIYYFVFFVCFVPIIRMVLPRTPVLDINVMNLILLGMVLLFMLYIGLKRRLRLFHPWIIWLGLYTIVVILSVAWSPVYSYDMVRIKDLFTNFLIPFMVAIMGLNVLDQREYIKVYVKACFITAVIIALVATYQLLSGTADYEGYRAAGSLGNANGTALFLMMLASTMMLGLEYKIINRFFGITAIAITLGGILCTISRKGIVAMALCIILYLLFSRKYKAVLATILCTFVVIGTLFFIPTFYQRFEQRELSSEFTARAEMARIGVRMFLDHPIQGLGYKGYYENVIRYHPLYWDIKNEAHNCYANALSDYGLLGFIPLSMVLLYPLFFAGRRLRYAREGGMEASLPKVIISSGIPFLMSAYFAGALFNDYSIMCLFYAQCALVLSVQPQTAHTYVLAKPIRS